MNTLQKIQKLNEMATTLIETDNILTNDVENKLLNKNPKAKQTAEQKIKQDIMNIQKAKSEDEVTYILKSDESLSLLPEDAKIRMLDALIYIYSYLRRLGYGRLSSYIFTRTLLYKNVCSFITNGQIDKQELQQVLKEITSSPTKTTLITILKSIGYYALSLIIPILQLPYLWGIFQSIRYFIKILKTDITNYDLEYKIEPNKKQQLPLPPAIEETINVMYNKYKKLQLIS